VIEQDLRDGWLRSSLAVLAELGTAGTVVELAMHGHWDSGIQVIAFVPVGLLAIGVAILFARPNRRALLVARAIAVLVAGLSLFGIFEHVYANYEAGPLDYRYEARWEGMPASSRWWTAFTKSVGPSPPLAPGILGQSALALTFATIGHPALATGRTTTRNVDGASRRGDKLRLALGYPRRR
jgi:hypothetical protein